eukprot:2898322-Lingulodinium_polyedra.AAC.1
MQPAFAAPPFQPGGAVAITADVVMGGAGAEMGAALCDHAAAGALADRAVAGPPADPVPDERDGRAPPCPLPDVFFFKV